LKRFSLIALVLLNGNLVAQDILSKEQKNAIKYSQEKIEQDSSKLKKDWINPITYTYSQLDGDTSTKGIEKKSIINISQPIFKSGGIYSAIKYANALKSSNSFTLSLEEKSAIKSANQILFNIYKSNLLIAKQELTITNSLIEIANKRESVLNGLLDISFLNNAILNTNKQKENLLLLEFQKISYINNFDNLTASSYKKFSLPSLKLIDDEAEYLANNIYIKRGIANTNTKEYLKGVITSKYLPTLNANYTNINNHTTDTKTKTYGFSIVVPLNINFHSDISSSKVDFLKSRNQEKIIARNELNFFKTQIAKIKMIEKKIILTKENIKSYEKLLAQVKELEESGLKTKDDVLVFENSKKAEIINIKIFEYDRQIELLELYARVTDVI